MKILENEIKGKVFYCKDYTDTDVIAPGRYDPIEGDEALAKIALIDYPSDSKFYNQKTKKSDYSIIIAGKDFGCGSSRETAPLALYAAGVRAIIAKSFARIFFRNCINMGGLIPIVLDHNFDFDVQNEHATINYQERKITFKKENYFFDDLGELNKILEAGGLSNYIKQKG